MQPVGAGAPLKAILERIGFKSLNEIIRQNQEADRKATGLLSEGKAMDALDIYQSKGQIIIKDTSLAAQQALINQWLQHLEGNITARLSNTIILAHRNSDVMVLNQLARKYLISSGFLIENNNNLEAETSKGKIHLTVGDRILFLKNDSELEVKNGHFATITSIHGSNITAEIKSGKTTRDVSFNTKEYQDFTYGYAATIYKTQGTTVDDCFVYAGGKYWNRNLTYVALSRHKDNVHLFADQETHKDFNTLKKNMGRLSIKDAVLDYPLSFALRYGIDEESALGRCITTFGEIKEKIKDKWLFISNIEAYNERQQQESNQAIIQQQRQDAITVAKFVDLRQEIGRSWSVLKSELTQEQAPEQHSSYIKIKEMSLERNKLAHDIFFHLRKYKLAMELNGIDSESVKSYAKEHERHEHILIYEQAIKGKSLLVAGKCAEEIISNGKEYAHQLKEQGLDWQATYEHAQDYRKRQFYYKLKPEQKELYQDLIKYQSLNKNSGQAWEKVYKAKEAQEQGKAQRNNQQHEKLAIAKAWSQKKDELAFKIQNNREAYTPFIDKFKVNTERLEKAAKHYEQRHLQQVQVVKPSFEIKGQQIIISESLLKQFKDYIEASAKTNEYSKKQRETTLNNNQAERQHFKKLVNESNKKKLELGTAILEDDKLWAQVKSLKPAMSYLEGFNQEVFKDQVKQNCFEIKELHKFSREITYTVREHEQSLQQSRSKGMRL